MGTTINGTGSVANPVTVNTGAKTINGAANLTFAGIFTISGAVTVTNNGTITSTAALSITGTVAGSTWVNAANSTLNVAGVLLTTAGGGTLTASANPNTVNYNSTTAPQTVKTATYYHLTFNNTGQIATLNGATIVNGNLTITSGTFSTSSQTLTVSGNLVVNGTLAGTGAITLNGSGTTIDGTGTITHTGTKTITNDKTISASASLTVSGTLALSTGTTVTNNSVITVVNITGTDGTSAWTNAVNSTLNVSGALLATGSLTANANPNTVNYNGTGAQTVKGTTYYHLTINKSSGTATLGAATTVNGNLTITSGTLSDGNFQITGNGTGNFTMAASTSLLLTSTTTFPNTFITANISLDPTSTVNYTGTTQTISGTPVYGNLTLGGSGNKTAPAGTLTIKGNYTNSGSAVFANNGGIVLLSGTTQQTLSGTMTGTSAFNNITITNTTTNPSVVFSASATAATATITTGSVKVQFNAGSTYTFTNINFAGALGNLIQFRSSTPGTQWGLVVTGTQTVLYVNPQDSDASGGNTIVADSTSLDGGNNLNWAFGGSCTSIASGNWNDGTKWTAPCNVSGPGASNDAIITSGTTMTVTAAAAAAGITINSAAVANGITLSGTNTLTVGGGSGSITMNAPSAGVNSTVNVGAGTLSAGRIAIPGSGTGGRNAIVTVSTGTITLTNSIVFSGTAAQAQLTFTGAGTVNVAGNLTSGGTLTTTGNGTINFNGGVAQTIGAYTTYNNVTINNTSGGVSFAAGTTTIGGTLTVTTGTINFGAATTTVTGATSVSNTLAIPSGIGTSTFTGNVTINNGGTWNDTAAVSVSFGGNLQNNGTFTASNATYTFSGAVKTIGGANPISIPNLTVSGTVTNTGTLTVSTALAGAGTLANGSNATLNLTGTVTITTLDATTNTPNTVVYNGAGPQTVKATTYHHLTINNPGFTATLGGATTVNGNFTIAASSTLDGSTFTLSLKGNYTNNGTFTATTSTVTLAGTTQQTLSGNMTAAASSAFNNLTITNNSGTDPVTSPSVIFTAGADASTVTITTVSVKVRFKAGSTYTFTNINFAGASGSLIQFRSSTPGTQWGLTVSGTQTVSYVNPQDSDARSGDTIVGGTTSSDGGNNLNWAFGGTCTSTGTGNWNDGTKWTAPCNVSGPGASNIVVIASGHTMTVTAAGAAAGITINDPVASSNGITLSGANALTVGAGGGAITLKASTGAGNATLAVGAGTLSAGGINIAGGGSTGNTVVTISTGTITVGGDVIFSGTAARAQLTFTGTGTLNISGNLTGGGTLTTVAGSTINFNGTAAQSAGGYTYDILKVNNTAGVTLSSPAAVSTLTIGDVTANSVFNDNGFQVTSTGTLNLTSGNLRLGGAGTATTFPAFATRNISAGTMVEYRAGVAQTVSTTPAYSNLKISGVGVKTLGGSITIGQNLTVNDPVGANLTLSGDITLTVNGTLIVTGTGSSMIQAVPATTFATIVATTMQVDAGNFVDASYKGCGSSMSYNWVATGCVDKGTPGPFANYGEGGDSGTFSCGGGCTGGYGGGGGGYGGAGGNGSGTVPGLGGYAYGSVDMNPPATQIMMGSGGGNGLGVNGGNHGGAGGVGAGAMKLTVSGTLTLNGTIHADGQVGNPAVGCCVWGGGGGGSGGSIYITAGTLAGSGVITANGGTGGSGSDSGGGGGGGRVYISAGSITMPLTTTTLQAMGGDSPGGASYVGNAGSVYVLRDNDSSGTTTSPDDLTFGGTGSFTPGGGTLTIHTLTLQATGNSGTAARETGTVTINGNLTTDPSVGALTLSTGLTVTGNVIAPSWTETAGVSSVGGTTSLTGALTVSGGSLTLTGNATVGTATTVSGTGVVTLKDTILNSPTVNVTGGAGAEILAVPINTYSRIVATTMQVDSGNFVDASNTGCGASMSFDGAIPGCVDKGTPGPFANYGEGGDSGTFSCGGGCTGGYGGGGGG
ncbi:MAG: hypothetical protein HY283_05915, partial [Nitrospirae bacterium]|nr:hypothetical protein [Nitrospirota bacterium]